MKRKKCGRHTRGRRRYSERATGLEPATSSLGSWHSTTELRPRVAAESIAEESEGKEAEASCLLGCRRVQKTLQIRLTDRRLARRHVVQPSVAHPPLELTHQIEEMVEGVDDEQKRLIVIDLEVLVDDPLQLDGIALNLGRLNGVRNLTVGAEQAAAVNLEIAVPPHQPELDGKPEKSGHRLEDAGDPPNFFFFVFNPRDDLRSRMGAVPEAYQRIGKRPVRVHRDMARNVVEDVRLRQIIQRRPVADRDGGRKFPTAKTVKEEK